jgi:DNA-binding transcriptional MerR regulator
MAEVQAGYLSIGEVLGLLLEEFPDVTISKIRFLESQGLIAPERTPSGYRKFYDADVELLRVILREQRENYLPLRVIKDRLDSGAIDPSGELAKPHEQPSAAPSVDVSNPPAVGHSDDAPDVPSSAIASHPAAARPSFAATSTTGGRGPHDDGVAPTVSRWEQRASGDRDDHTPVAPQLLPGVLLERAELCAMTGVTAAELADLEQYGIVTGRGSGGTTLYGDEAVEVAKVAGAFLRAGVDARHLRGWKTSAEREASLYEQLITPKLRQRNPGARAEANEQLRELDALGGRLRAAMMRAALRHHLDG